ncbi:hypothetical protein P154DRAFT_526995 [Amniculicola lignicola CBS 123094]|uniref:T cell CD4 receptor C-terminal region domain-containing protein n=1 Tax=Amniculicola lignicola CBS 123094 TaxID=1392246 RepID=A0A6A5W0P7_9PLEO|nr:hypothetical protein P154DRAFT_526995 [Amniculicola lignicola CBS 123094]
MARPARRRFAYKNGGKPEESKTEDDDHSKTDDDVQETKAWQPSWTGLPTQTPMNWFLSQSQTQFSSSASETVISSQTIPAASEFVRVTSVSSGAVPLPTQSGGDDDNNVDFGTDDDKDESNHGIPYAAGVVPIVLLAIIGVAIFFCLRKRKRQRRAKALAQSEAQKLQEVKARNQSYVQPLYAAPPPPAPTQAQYLAPPNQVSPSGPSNPPPVILGPIPGSSGAYFTGIDTSDVMSVNERTGLAALPSVGERNGLGDPFADGNSVQDEPPPPYRPRSVATLSRDTSVRSTNSAFVRSQTHLPHQSQAQPYASPFADPLHEDDMVPVLSTPARRRQPDTLSVVSDVSDQNDPVVSRPNV